MGVHAARGLPASHRSTSSQVLGRRLDVRENKAKSKLTFKTSSQISVFLRREDGILISSLRVWPCDMLWPTNGGGGDTYRFPTEVLGAGSSLFRRETWRAFAIRQQSSRGSCSVSLSPGARRIVVAQGLGARGHPTRGTLLFPTPRFWSHLLPQQNLG